MWGITPIKSRVDFPKQRSLQGNPISRLGKGGDVGGGFLTTGADSRGSNTTIDVTNGPKPGAWYVHRGPVAAWAINFSNLAAPVPSTTSQMNVLGTQAIARTIPTNPLSGMGQFIGELRDLPRLANVPEWADTIRHFRSKTKHINFDKLSREAADETLNQLFGWTPFVQDLKKFFAVAKDSARQARIYAKHANKTVRRTYNFPASSNTVTEVGGNAYGDPPVPTFLVATPGKLTHTVRTEVRQWFKGAYTYYLPPIIPSDNGFVQFINKCKQTEAYANRLYGLRLTPDLLYKLTPWSWALDWMSTSGDIVHNWSAFQNDGLVLRYGYVMEHRSTTEWYTVNGLTLVGGQVLNLAQARTSWSKMRTRGTPYGFGVNPASFTGKQWAVIAALGISKNPLSLNF